MDEIREINGRKYRCVVEQDPDAQSPGEWEGDEEDMFLGHTHWDRHFSVGNENWHLERCREFCEWGEGPYDVSDLDLDDECHKDQFERILAEYEDAQEGIARQGYTYILHPVRVTGQSGWYRLSETSHDRADGYIMVKQKTCLLSALSDISMDGPSMEERVAGYIKTWNQYLQGEVYWVRVEDLEDGRFEESVGGVYGYAEAKKVVEETIQWLRKKAGEEVSSV